MVKVFKEMFTTDSRYGTFSKRQSFPTIVSKRNAFDVHQIHIHPPLLDEGAAAYIHGKIIFFDYLVYFHCGEGIERVV